MSARKLWVRVANLPPDAATVLLAQQPQQQGAQESPGKVTYLEDIPKVGLRDAQRFINSSSEEFDAMATGKAG